MPALRSNEFIRPRLRIVPSGPYVDPKSITAWYFPGIILLERQQPIYTVDCIVHDPPHFILCDVGIRGFAGTGCTEPASM